ncbi:hypothetical protein ACIGXM_14615 [Kitasatospora sp. NPDC052896]|uniref:hypothetical protein n=1 Tax=Kitasatospora sp. NPDC052896 TaxID=3364061 RepID=UPI0037CBA0A0
MQRMTAANGWKIIHQARVKDPRSGEHDGQWLGWDGETEWIVGRQFTGKEPDGFDRSGAWWYSHYFVGKPSDHQNRVGAVADYLEMAEKTTHVWTSIFEQRVRETIDRHLAGRVPVESTALLAAGWAEGQRAGGSALGSTVPLKLTDAKYELLGYLRRTEHSAALSITPNSITYEQAEGLIVAATGPIRFEFGRNTYWLGEG